MTTKLTQSSACLLSWLQEVEGKAFTSLLAQGAVQIEK
jgi:hypothetical protein